MTTVTVSGPLFTGQAESAMNSAVKQIRENVADQGKKLVAAAFLGSIKADRGRFESSFKVIDRSTVFDSHSGSKTYSLPEIVESGELVVTTDLATYGPWLEGTGSRNETTRFKGYYGFRKAGEALDMQAEGIAEDTLSHYVREMN